MPEPDSQKYSLEPSVRMGGGIRSGEKLAGFSRPSLVICVKARILGGRDARIHQKASARTTTTPAPTKIKGHRFAEIGFAETGFTTALSIGKPVEAAVTVGWTPVEAAGGAAVSEIAGTRDPEDPDPESISRFKRFKSVRISDADW
jgi:hypothetical protein